LTTGYTYNGLGPAQPVQERRDHPQRRADSGAAGRRESAPVRGLTESSGQPKPRLAASCRMRRHRLRLHRRELRSADGAGVSAGQGRYHSIFCTAYGQYFTAGEASVNPYVASKDSIDSEKGRQTGIGSGSIIHFNNQAE
jgi:hypothetical protein